MTTTSTNGQASAYETIKAKVLDQVEAGRIDPQGARDDVQARVAEVARDYQRQAHLSDELTALADPEPMAARVTAAVCDYGPLTELLARDDVEEIMIQGSQLSYITADGQTHFPAAGVSEAEYRSHIERLLQGTDTQLDPAHAIQTVGLAGHKRLAVKSPPVADQLTVNIRQPVISRANLADLVGRDTLSAAAAELLWLCMQVRSRVVVAGVPGSGKTHLTKALVAATPPHHVVRVNEEAREINVPLMQGGYCQATGRPNQTLRALIKADLLFRPSLLVVGETLGEEAIELLRPLNQGTGFLTTLNINEASDAVDMLTQCAALSGENVDQELLRQLFAKAVEFVVFVDHDERARTPRRVTEICYVEKHLRGGEAVYEPLFTRESVDAPLTWTGAMPDAAVCHKLEKALPERAESLAGVLDGRVRAGGLT